MDVGHGVQRAAEPRAVHARPHVDAGFVRHRVTQKGIPGGLLSGMLFQYPGLMMMSLAGAGAAEVLVNPDDWLRGVSAGLSAAGVALVVSAAVGLAKGQCKDQTTSALCLMSAVVAYYYVSNWIFPLLIVVGGLTTVYANRKALVKMPDANETIAHLGLSKVGGGLLILAWIVIWVVVVSFTSTTEYADNKELHWFEAFYRTGSIIFGGGQVVLPLLLKDVTDVAVTCVDAAGAAVAAGTVGPPASPWRPRSPGSRRNSSSPGSPSSRRCPVRCSTSPRT